MKVRLYDAALVRHLKRAAKERARRAGRKSARGKWWKGGGGSPAAFWWIWLLANVVRVMAQPGNAPQLKGYVLSAMSLALAGVALSQARKLVGKLTTDGERVVLLLPDFQQRFLRVGCSSVCGKNSLDTGASFRHLFSNE